MLTLFGFGPGVKSWGIFLFSGNEFPVPFFDSLRGAVVTVAHGKP
jgi:hypothetical protein